MSSWLPFHSSLDFKRATPLPLVNHITANLWQYRGGRTEHQLQVPPTISPLFSLPRRTNAKRISEMEKCDARYLFRGTMSACLRTFAQMDLTSGRDGDRCYSLSPTCTKWCHAGLNDMYGSVIVTESKMGWGESRWEGERANGRWREPAGGGENRWEGERADGRGSKGIWKWDFRGKQRARPKIYLINLFNCSPIILVLPTPSQT